MAPFPELAPSGRTEQAFAIFYTGTIGAGATAPIFFGLLGDAVGPHGAMMATAATAAAILPLAIALAPGLAAWVRDGNAKSSTRPESKI
jgi:FSR family fosmidomycin resistance protein-like MFS transporter